MKAPVVSGDGENSLALCIRQLSAVLLEVAQCRLPHRSSVQ